MQNRKICAIMLIGMTLALAMFMLSTPRAKATLIGDLNDDGKVDVKDIYIASKAFGSVPGDSNWNAIADMNLDGSINLKDIFIIASHYG